MESVEWVFGLVKYFLRTVLFRQTSISCHNTLDRLTFWTCENV